MRYIIAIVLLTVSACVNDHVVVEHLPVKCDSIAPPEFTDILPIIISRCATAGCHDANNDYIPHLVTEDQIIANRSDCISQIERGAMPPLSYALTESEKRNILCWLNYGK